MFDSYVFEILITFPVDVMDEIPAIEESIQSWNRLHSKEKNITLISRRWDRDTYPSKSGNRPQDAINEQIGSNADILIAIFWTRLGTQTGSHESGSVEEIENHIEAGKPAMVFFLNKNIMPDKLDNDQHERLMDFKNKYKNKALFKDIKSQDSGTVFAAISMLLTQNKYVQDILEQNRYNFEIKDFKKLKFEYQFSPPMDGYRLWLQNGPYQWIEKAPYSPGISEKLYLCVGTSEWINNVRGTIVFSTWRDDEHGFEIFIPNPNQPDMRLYWRIINKLHNDWEPLGITPITYF